MMTFFKDAILSPWKSTGERKDAGIALGAIVLSMIAASLMTFIHLRILYGEYVLFSTAYVFMILMVLLFLIFLGMTYVMNKIAVRESRSLKQVFSDVSGLGVGVIVLYMVMILLFSFVPYQLGLIVLLIFNLLMISVPVYILFNYAGKHGTRINVYIASAVYYIIVLAGGTIFFWPVVRVGLNGLFY